MHYIFESERTFYDNFFNLLNNNKKDDFFGSVTEEDLEEYDDYEDILDTLWISLDNAIHEYLHYGLDIYLEVSKDELWNTIPLLVGIWKRYNEMFSWVIIKLEDNGYCSTKYIIENQEILNGDDFQQEEQLKQFIWNNYFNNIFILIADLLLYDDNVWTYVAMSSEFEENFSEKIIYIPIEWLNSSIYINSTLMREDLNIDNEEY